MDQWNRRSPGSQRESHEFRDVGGVEGVGPRHGGNGLRRLRGNDAAPSLRAGERHLEIEHRLEHAGIGENSRERFGGGQAVHQSREHYLILHVPILHIEENSFRFALQMDLDGPRVRLSGHWLCEQRFPPVGRY